MIRYLLLIVILSIVNLSVCFGQASTTVYGQGGSFTTNTQNNGGISATSLSTPTGVALDTAGNLYTLDASNNRALFYLKGSTTATRVYGQAGSFTSSAINNGGISANSLGSPSDLALDLSNNLYISDGQNHRVLFYLVGSTTATRVYGQGGSFTTNTQNNGGISATSLSSPNAIFVDASGNLYVADGGNNRVLFYLSGATTATKVYGQASFAMSAFTPITASSLFSPSCISVDSSNNVYIVDGGNSRVLFYLSGSTIATRVYGQFGSFTIGDFSNPGGVSANTLSKPRGVIHDNSNNVYIADSLNNRILFYSGTSTIASSSWGQGGLLTSNNVNNGGITASSLQNPFRMTLDSQSNLYVSDGLNNRILVYSPSQTTTSSQTTAPASTTCFHETTIITYNNTEYSDLTIQRNSECYIPHVVTTNGILVRLDCDFNRKEKTLRLTSDHLVYAKTNRNSRTQLVEVASLNIGSILFEDIEEKRKCEVQHIEKEFNQKYFGLNCINSIVLANGIKTSTFGNYHHFPEAWMCVIGNIFGIEKASIYGDKIATLLFNFGFLH